MAISLSKYFSGVGVKRLSQVEVDPVTSNQHELNGVTAFKSIFGVNKIDFKAKFVFLGDEEEKIIEHEGFVTWYDAREAHATRSEFRLYYSDNQIIPSSSVGDLILVGRRDKDQVLVIVAERNSTIEQQLLWLFGFEEVESKFNVKSFTEIETDIGFAGRYIVSSLGIEIEEASPDYLEILLKRYGATFPSTKEFSDFARSTVKNVSAKEAPDDTLIAWMEREEMLFRTLETAIVKKRLEEGFGEDGTDVDEFISFSLSVQNRRKSRAGHSLENNLAVIFNQNLISYSKGATTERNNKPDFLFPGKDQYHNPTVNTALLTMLGVKTTAKDRWRQVLSEAAKIPNKHLITLEPAISRNQTEEMQANNLQLVIPSPLLGTYHPSQRGQLINLKDFIEMVSAKQFEYRKST